MASRPISGQITRCRTSIRELWTSIRVFVASMRLPSVSNSRVDFGEPRFSCGFQTSQTGVHFGPEFGELGLR